MHTTKYIYIVKLYIVSKEFDHDISKNSINSIFNVFYIKVIV